MNYLAVIVTIGFVLTVACLYWIGSTLEKIDTKLDRIADHPMFR